MLALKIEERLTLEEVFEHPWMKDAEMPT